MYIKQTRDLVYCTDNGVDCDSVAAALSSEIDELLEGEADCSSHCERSDIANALAQKPAVLAKLAKLYERAEEVRNQAAALPQTELDAPTALARMKEGFVVRQITLPYGALFFYQTINGDIRSWGRGGSENYVHPGSHEWWLATHKANIFIAAARATNPVDIHTYTWLD
jgi:hypothetical protein